MKVIGGLWKNNYKYRKTDPDYRGKADLISDSNIKLLKNLIIKGWAKTSKKGTPYLTISVTWPTDPKTERSIRDEGPYAPTNVEPVKWLEQDRPSLPPVSGEGNPEEDERSESDGADHSPDGFGGGKRE